MIAITFDSKSILNYNLNEFNSYGICKQYQIDHDISQSNFSAENRINIRYVWNENQKNSSILYYELYHYSNKELLLIAQLFGNFITKYYSNYEFVGDKIINENGEIIGINFISQLKNGHKTGAFILNTAHFSNFMNLDFQNYFTNLIKYLEVNSLTLDLLE